VIGLIRQKKDIQQYNVEKAPKDGNNNNVNPQVAKRLWAATESCYCNNTQELGT
jgi:hypothetical protein